ncbi:MAG: hypothetical protein ACPGZP_07275 [Panacagrimonas sp.]
MIRNRGRKTWLALLVAVPCAASAHNYSYLEGGLVNQDQGSDDETGIRIAGSYDLAPPIALFGEYADIDDYEQITAGALFHTALDKQLDLVLGASLENVDVGVDDDTGIGLRGGLRWQPINHLEIHPEVRYVDVFDEDSTSVRVAGLFSVTPELDLQVAAQGGDDDRFEVGVRYNFGPRSTGR